jgi:Asp/Glu/hydantoin racemase
MIRRTLSVLNATKGSRTIIRDPRKAKDLREKARSAVAIQKETALQHQPPQEVGQRIAFEPSTQNQQSLGIGSYVLAGAGVALGFSIVGALFGGF